VLGVRSRSRGAAAWQTISANLATTDTSVNSAEMTGNPAQTIDILANLRIGTLAVEFMPWCAARTHLRGSTRHPR
jgi:hypothetical protein